MLISLSPIKSPATAQLIQKLLTPFALLLVFGCSHPDAEQVSVAVRPTFVGSEQCADCHQAEFGQWQGSHHQLAMQIASEETVLGDFSSQTVPYFGTETTFLKRDDAFFARTQNAAGDIEEFEITHTFGVDPLQQYLVDLPGGRKQALQFAWDSRPAQSGGQRWFHLYPDEYIGPDDPLHWTGRYFNWNFMCAECHSTNVKMAYDVNTNSFATTFDEISVGCESCHGPGSLHISLARDGSFKETSGLLLDFNDRADSAWIMNAATGIAERNRPNTIRQEPESCARCHSRRSVISSEYEYGTALLNTHTLSLLDENLYHADGRIQDEVYVYGSFVQSKMYAAGVTCSDCHNPHSGDLNAGPDPNNTCAQCHLPAIFDSSDHSDRNKGDCVECHMTSTTYMGVDGRRDHSFRLPNTASNPQHYGAVIAAGRRGGENEKLLIGIANEAFPPIARATMLSLLEPIPDDGDIQPLLEQLDSGEALVRIAALRALRNQAPGTIARSGSHLLRDPIRGVRVEAALTFLEYRDLLPLEDARAFPDTIDELRQSMLGNANIPEVALNLAELESRLGNTPEASRLYQHAILIDPGFAAAHHAYGLFLVREAQSESALEHLRLATDLDPEFARYVYVYGVALNSLQKADDAIAVLTIAHQKFKEDIDIAWALATMLRDSGEREVARDIAIEMRVVFPDDERFETLLKSLDHQAALEY